VVTPLFLLACGPVPGEAPADPTPAMGAVPSLIRLSLDLRGVRPSIDEITRVEADPGEVDTLVDTFLADVRFGDRVRSLFADTWRTRYESYNIKAANYGLTDEATFETSVGEAPLQVLAYIAVNDLPYTDLVTADWTLADETLGSVWPVDYPAGASGWLRVPYTDGRPHAGVLASNTLWWRYYSNESNANRGRANQISRILLCNDYLSRPIAFDPDVLLVDPEDVGAAVQTNSTCVNCHSSLDPLASYLYGFWWYDLPSAAESTTYHAERETLWRTHTGVAPAYYGDPGYSLEDLGDQIAADPRFTSCAVEQVFEALLRRDAGVDDVDALATHRDAFLEGGVTLRALFRSVVQDPRYRAGPTSVAGYVPKKLVSADLLASEVADLTGFDWRFQAKAMLASDRSGLRTLAGGVDGDGVTVAPTLPNPTLLLVQERLAELAAAYAVEHDAASPVADRRLFGDIDFTETPDTARAPMITQLQDLHLRVLGEHAATDSAAIGDDLDLWSAVYAVDGTTRAAWGAVLGALLRDPALLLY
jgi:hypothetical protein